MKKEIKLRVGMKVICIYKSISYIHNKTGRVIKVDSTDSVGVRFDHTNTNFHDCNGRCENNRGFWLDSSHLKPISDYIDDWESTEAKGKKK